MTLADDLTHRIAALPPPHAVWGRVAGVLGLRVEVAGLGAHAPVGTRLSLEPAGRATPVLCEVVGFAGGRALALPFGTLDGVGPGTRAQVVEGRAAIAPTRAWLGRVIDALGRPIDGLGPLPTGQAAVPLRNAPPPPTARARLGGQLDLGVRAVNTFTAMRRGQRLGIFAGSGVGKSVLLSMMARYTAAEVAVIGLVGERGREVADFLADDLGPEGLARSVVVVATGDEPALARRQAAYMTLAVAEYFRDAGADVLCLMDSLTRFAMAQREIGLSAGEPPTAKGYPPTTFGELSRLLERAGPGAAGASGSITGLFSVLVEGGDMDEPVADAVRGLVDGHIVMRRAIADRGRYPAIDVLGSISRAMPDILAPERREMVRRAKQVITTYEDMAELIRLGAYRRGADAAVDEAVALYPRLEAFLAQDKAERSDAEAGFAALAEIVGAADASAGAYSQT
jgi:flagellum-specific ATP synthase